MQINHKELLEKAKESYKYAYAPYSEFFVGACIQYEDGSIYCGCNVENASYGLSLCAERNALSTAIADGQKGKPIAIAIACKNVEKCFPCGACRQWIYEFNKDAIVILETKNDDSILYNISELFPHGFVL